MMPFADMPSDAPWLQGLTPPSHPFEAKGLGHAPYQCVGCVVNENLGGCAYCGAAIKYEFEIIDRDGKGFRVGSECVKRTGAALKDFTKHRIDLARKLRAARDARKAETLSADVAKWRQEHSDIAAWLDDRAPSWGFAASLLQWLAGHGSLTVNQEIAARNAMNADKARAAARKADAQQRTAVAPVVTIEAIEQAFDRARGAGIKYPKLRLGDYVFKPAASHGKNPGAVYVTTRKQAGEDEGEYLGKVTGGRFLKVRSCTNEQESQVVAVCKDPKAAAIAYGKRFGSCAVCGRTLTDGESIDRGIGPVCADKYGW